MGIVYCAENIVNGYKYIGITVQSLEIRKRSHLNAAFNPKSVGYNRPFMKALRENKFKWSILNESDSEIELKKLERFYIDKYKTYIGFDNCKGYNATLGGDGVSVFREEVYRVDSETYALKETYKNLSEVNNVFNTKIHIMACCQGTRNSAYGDVWYYKSDYSILDKKELIKDVDCRINKIYKLDESKNIKEKFRNLESLLKTYGLKFKDIYLNSIKEHICYARDFYNGDFNNGLSCRDNIVLQYDTKGNLLNIFLSLHDAENKTGVFRESITEVCKHTKITAGGFQWRFIEDSQNIFEVKVGLENSIKEVSQYSKEGFYIKTFKSMSEAERQLGISSSSISKVCRGLKQTAGGFRWEYGHNKTALESLVICKENQKIPVGFVDDTGNIQFFESINEASRKTGFSSSYISKQCKNMYKKSNRFFYKK